MRPPQSADRLQPLIGLDDRFAACVVPGDDPPYFQRHGFPPLGCLVGLAFAGASRDANA